MPVGVVGRHRHQCDAGAGRRHELPVGVVAPVVRHLQDVGPQIGAPAPEPGLRLGTQVAGEQDRQAADLGAHHHRQIVGGCAAGRLARIRGEHLQRHLPHGAPVAREQGQPPSSGPVDEGVETGRAVVGRREGAGGDLTHVTTRQGPGEAAYVIGVEVGDQDQRQGRDAEPVQALVDRRDVRSGVDEDAGASPEGQCDGVALTHVAHHGQRLGRRPSAQDLAQRPPDDDQPDQRGEGDRSQPCEPPQQPPRDEQHPSEQQRSSGAGRPPGRSVRHRGGPGRHPHQPAGRPPGRPDEDVGSSRPEGGKDGRQQTKHGGRCHGGRGEQVRRQRHQAHGSVERGQQWGGGRTGGGADREGIGQDGRAATVPQLPGPARREQHDGGRRDDREGEADVDRQRRIEDEQCAHGGRQRRDCLPRPPRGECQQRDRAHGCCPDHARTRARQDDEHHQSQTRNGRLHPPVRGPTAQRPEHAREHDRDVGPGHRRQVRQPGSAELLGQDRVHGPGVADRQPREQTGRARFQHASGRPGQTVAHFRRRLLHRAGATERSRRSSGRQDGDDRFPPARRCSADADAHPLAGHQLGPPVGRCEQQDRVVDDVAPHPDDQLDDRRVGHDAAGPGPLKALRIAVQFEDDRDRAARLGDRAQR